MVGMITMGLRLGAGIASKMSRVKDVIFDNLHTEDARNLVAEDGTYLLF